MFSKSNNSSGKHMICDLTNIKNIELLNDSTKIKELFDNICKKYNYTVLNRMEHIFKPQGITILYLLSESHISIHTFPERNYAALDIYTCREYDNNDIYEEIYVYITKEFKAEKEKPIIIDRTFTQGTYVPFRPPETPPSQGNQGSP
jgi:S-adenosylmethionine decarboxylase proenzyme